jgi:hypothetical protein
MSKTLYPRMELLQSLYELTADITPNRFISTRPNAVGQQMEEFLLIRLPQRIAQPGDTYQLTTGQIAVFVRDIQGGLENTLMLEAMQEAVCSLFPIRSPKYLATRPMLLPGGSDGAGFHSLIIQFNIRIHKDFEIHPTENLTL